MSEASSEPRPSVGLVAELWYEVAPELHDPGVLETLRALSPGTQAQQGSLTVPDPGAGARPLLTVVLAASPLGTDGKQLPDVSQTWDWPDAESSVARGRASVLVTEVGTTGSTPQQRVSALTAVVAELVRSTEPLVISWPQSMRVANPADFEVDDLDGVVNVRLFAVAGDTEAMVMDTLGLHIFGLPDVQCHFRGRDPGAVAAMLFATGVYVFESGDVILDGNTISEPDGQGRYVCRREPALIQPARTVLDVDLGDPYAAGERDRSASPRR